MEFHLPPVEIDRRSGQEVFRFHDRTLPANLLGFWQWQGSDLLNNAQRGVLAEYIVALALGIDTPVRTEWDAYDLVSPRGTKIEIKSSAYCQSWGQSKHSDINFGVAPTRALDPATNCYAAERKRQADVYVFCVLHHRDKATVDPLRLEQWSFYLITSKQLNERIGNQARIALSGLERLEAVQADFESLPARFREIEAALPGVPPEQNPR